MAYTYENVVGASAFFSALLQAAKSRAALIVIPAIASHFFDFIGILL